MEDIVKMAITALLAGGVGWFVALRKAPAEIRVLTSQEKKNNADAANTATDAMINLLKFMQEERAENTKRIDELEAHRAQRNREIDELKVKIQSDLMETRNLRADYASAQKRIIKLEDMAIKMGEYIDTMKTKMQEAGMGVPLNGDLMESVYRLRLKRDEAEQLRKAGK